MRSQEEICGLPEVNGAPIPEIAQEDMEATSNLCDAGAEVEEDQDIAVTAEESQGLPESQRDYLIDLWPFARPMRHLSEASSFSIASCGFVHSRFVPVPMIASRGFYAQVFRDVTQLAGLTHVVAFTTTAHPAQALAARSLGCASW